MNVLSLFGGIECGYPSFADNKIEIGKYYSCEIDKYAKAITRYNSGIGYELFMQFVRAVIETKPKYFLYENNHSIHKDIKEAIAKELGVDFCMINSAKVSGQNRKRVYYTNIPDVTHPEDLGILLEDILETEVDEKYYVSNEVVEKFIEAKRVSEYNGEGSIKLGHFNSGAQGDRVYSTQAKSVTLSANGGGRGAKTGLYCVAMRGRYGENGKTFQNIEPRYDGKTNTLTTVQKDNMLFNSEEYRIRRLTPLEGERLQTLEDNWTKYGIDEKGNKIEISDSQRLRCIGNGWTRKVITHILSFIPRE